MKVKTLWVHTIDPYLSREYPMVLPLGVPREVTRIWVELEDGRWQELSWVNTEDEGIVCPEVVTILPLPSTTNPSTTSMSSS